MNIKEFVKKYYKVNREVLMRGYLYKQGYTNREAHKAVAAYKKLRSLEREHQRAVQ